ncbi:MAG: MarR family transcriptional regulator [Acidimicrobiia bacterium]
MDEARWVDDFAEAWAREHAGSANTSGLILIILLARLSVLIDGFQATVLKPFDLNPSDYAVLSALRRSGSPYELAPHALSTALEISTGGMTKMLRRLENLGLVTRTDHPEDRRSKRVRLTPEGERTEEKAFEAFLASTHELLRTSSPADLESIDESLRRLVTLIEANYPR